MDDRGGATRATGGALSARTPWRRRVSRRLARSGLPEAACLRDPTGLISFRHESAVFSTYLSRLPRPPFDPHRDVGEARLRSGRIDADGSAALTRRGEKFAPHHVGGAASPVGRGVHNSDMLTLAEDLTQRAGARRRLLMAEIGQARVALVAGRLTVTDKMDGELRWRAHTSLDLGPAAHLRQALPLADARRRLSRAGGPVRSAPHRQWRSRR